MPLGAVVVALILVESEVELCPVLNHRTVERRQQHMVFVVEFRHGNDEQTMVLARVAVDERRGAVGTRAVRTEQLTTQRLLQVGHHSFF